jgi:Spy/CpxP family protein refolding chaperone
MKKFIVCSLGVGLGLALIVTLALAHGFGPNRNIKILLDHRLNGPFLPVLLLGERQFHQVQSLEAAFLRETEALKHNLLSKRTELRICLLGFGTERATVVNREKEIQYLQSLLQKKAVQLRQQIRKTLKPEQRAQFDASNPSMGIGYHIRRNAQ